MELDTGHHASPNHAVVLEKKAACGMMIQPLITVEPHRSRGELSKYNHKLKHYCTLNHQTSWESSSSSTEYGGTDCTSHVPNDGRALKTGGRLEAALGIKIGCRVSSSAQLQDLSFPVNRAAPYWSLSGALLIPDPSSPPCVRAEDRTVFELPKQL